MVEKNRYRLCIQLGGKGGILLDVHQSYFQKLHDFSIKLNSSLKFDDILKKTTSSLLDLIGGLGCHIVFTEDIKRDLEISTILHTGPKPFPLRMEESSGISGLTLRNRVPILINDTFLDARVNPGMIEWFGHRSMISVPIFVKEKAIGVIILYSEEVAFYNEEHIKVLIMFGNHLGLAIENARLIKTLENAAIIDGLTKAYNHTFFRNILKEKLQNLKPKEDLSLIIIDINDFKKVNDGFGHLTGDYILKEVSRIIKEALRPGDILARYGGDEFAILLPNCPKSKALGVKRRIEKIIKEYPFAFHGYEGQIQIASGLANYDQDGNTDTQLIETADKRMYSNKIRKVKKALNDLRR